MATYRYIATAFVATFVAMFFYEYLKEELNDGSLTRWGSHWITIIFTSCLASVITLILIGRYNELQQRARIAEEKLVKLSMLRKVMDKVNHHLNNLVQNMEIIELELEDEEAISPKTIQTLKKNIKETGEEMRRLSDLDDPDKEDVFKVKL